MKRLLVFVILGTAILTAAAGRAEDPPHLQFIQGLPKQDRIFRFHGCIEIIDSLLICRGPGIPYPNDIDKNLFNLQSIELCERIGLTTRYASRSDSPTRFFRPDDES